jgi:hypothetical protein
MYFYIAIKISNYFLPLEYVTDLVGELGNKEHIRLFALGTKGLWFDGMFITHYQNWKNKIK